MSADNIWNYESPGEKGLWYGLKTGYDDWKNPQYDHNNSKGQRTPGAQERWDAYSQHKTAGRRALQNGDITEEQFNNLKGKAGANTVIDYYVNREQSPFFHGMANNLTNIWYQGNQAMDTGTPWEEAKDYYQQDNGAEDTSVLRKPWQEIEAFKKQNK